MMAAFLIVVYIGVCALVIWQDPARGKK